MAAHVSVDGFKRTVCGRAIGRVRVVEGETIAELADNPLERADDDLEEFLAANLSVDCPVCRERGEALKELEQESGHVVSEPPRRDAVAGRVERAKIVLPNARVLTEWVEEDWLGQRVSVWRLIQAGDNDPDPRPRLTITGPTVTTTIYLPLPALDWLHKNASGIISTELQRAFQKAEAS